mmetsp:Transcript_12696/g.22458  ORF Transcript_12696/g.22458 Transcript_12696/m.22458 type:complete len:83 (+) Transcript_12696:131-379(+)
MSDNLPSRASQAASVARHADLVREALKVHSQCRTLLKTKKLACPSNLNEAIELCKDKKLIDAATAERYHSIRHAGNEGRHDW